MSTVLSSEAGARRDSATPESEAIRAQLQRIVSSRAFVDSPRLQEFLHYVVVETLAGRAGRIKGFTIAQEVFHREDVEDAQTSTIVRVEAGRLRRRIDEYYAAQGQDDPIRILVPKGGYVPVFETAEDGDHEAGSAPGTVSESLPDTAPAAFRRNVLAVLVVVVAVAVVVWLAPSLVGERPVAPVAMPADGLSKPAIAVLPFQAPDSDRDGERLATGLTEAIITDLSRLSDVDVIALSSVLALDGDNAGAAEIGEELAVTHILRGSVRGKWPTFRATAQLYETETGRHVWADRFDSELTDELVLESELSLKVVDSLTTSLHGGDRERLETRKSYNAEAYALYKQAMNLGNPPTNGNRLRVAMRAFEGIVDMEPSFAGGYAGGAYMHAFYAYFGHSRSPEQEIDTAIGLAEKSIELDPEFGMSYTALAFAYLARRDFDNAVSASAKAVAAQPNDPYVSVYHGVLLCFNGQAERGLPYAKRALRLDPLTPRTPYLNILGTILFQTGDYESALNAKRRNIERGGPESPGNQAYRASIYAALGRRDEANAELERYNANGGEFDFEDWVRRSFRREEDAERVLEPLRELGRST